MKGTDFITKKTCGNCLYYQLDDSGAEVCALKNCSLPQDEICEDYKCIFDSDEDEE